MKRYERMTKEEIIEVAIKGCVGCPMEGKLCENYGGCRHAKKIWFNEEIKTAPLITTIDSVAKLREVKKDYIKHCRSRHECRGCDYYYTDFDTNCFAKYLEQEVEV